jgi:hypothetical protein
MYSQHLSPSLSLSPSTSHLALPLFVSLTHCIIPLALTFLSRPLSVSLHLFQHSTLLCVVPPPSTSVVLFPFPFSHSVSAVTSMTFDLTTCQWCRCQIKGCGHPTTMNKCSKDYYYMNDVDVKLNAHQRTVFVLSTERQNLE